jgi:hypothetical protein
MFVLQNNGRFPIIIRDLNLHIEGGKSVDMDLTFRREMTEASVDLKNLLRCKKIVLLNKTDYKNEKPLPPQIKKENTAIEKTDPKSNEMLALLLKKFGDIEEVLKHVGSGTDISKEPEYTDETWAKLADLKAKNLMDNDKEVEKNFENIGNTTEKKDNSAIDMLNILNNLDNQGD